MGKDGLVHAGLVALHDLVAVAVAGAAVDDSEGDAAFVSFGQQGVALVLPQEEHQAVLALLDQVQHHLVACGVNHLHAAQTVIDGAGGHLQQLGGHGSSVDGEHGWFGAFERQHLGGLQLDISFHLLGGQVVLQRILVVGGDVDAVFELVSNYDVR